MNASALHSIVYKVLSLSWLAGPIFDKELRVSSRRRRNYVLRFVYPALLTVFISFVWTATMKSGGSASFVYQVSRMSQIGKHLTMMIVWFQFIAVQLIAVVMLSNAISDEIVHRTLGVLMTTPIGSFQIVTGKLFSKLFQLTLLLAISLPLLAIVRVFGGVPWDFVVSSLCVTFTAAVFAGSLSLVFSIYNRQAHEVIVRTVLVCFLFYALPAMIAWLVEFAYQVRIVPKTLPAYINPFMVMMYTSQTMLSPTAGGPGLSWPLHCAIIAGGAVLLLTLATVCVRRVGLRQATGQAGIFSTRKERRAAMRKRRTEARPTTTSRPIRRAKGPPIVWREFLSLRNKIGCLKGILGIVLALVIIAVTYGYCAHKGFLDRKEAHMAFISIYFFFALLRTTAAAATSISAEKEARTWPILLTSPLTERQIVLSKMIGSSMAGWAFWLLLLAHIVVFSVAGRIPLSALLPLALLVASSALLVSAVGVFFSSCFKRSSTSASVNLILFLWLTVPICQPLPASPILAAVMILGVAGGWDAVLGSSRTGSGYGGPLGAFLLSWIGLLVLVLTYLSLAFVAFAIAVTHTGRRSF
jgi:ABC-2 type transport system permease protein